MSNTVGCLIRSIVLVLLLTSSITANVQLAQALLLPAQTAISLRSFDAPGTGVLVYVESRRQVLEQIHTIVLGTLSFSVSSSSSPSPLRGPEARQKDARENPTLWTGTALPIMNLEQAMGNVNTTPRSEDIIWEMGRWPDPILRRPAQNVPDAYFGTETLRLACEALERTATVNGAVGLAAQQCGVDARIVYLEPEVGNEKNNLFSKKTKPALLMINPRIVDRSPEMDMMTWRETCLVLPPTWEAIVLRDADVEVEYQDLSGKWNSVVLTGERARAAQHEMDHDRGILLTDHVSFEEMESDTMRNIEEPGHSERMRIAYSRDVQSSILRSTIN